MKLKLTAALICILCVVIMAFSALQLEGLDTMESKPSAQAGIMDLRKINLQSVLVKLDGQWEFYDGKFLEHTELASGQHESDKKIVTVPGKWNEYGLDRGNPASYGYGTFHLRILLNDETRGVYGIKTTNIGMANNLFADGKLVGQSGLPGDSRGLYTLGNVPYTSSVQVDSNSLDLILWVSNFDYTPYSGIVNSIYFGNQSDIAGLRERASANEIIVSTAFIFLGLIFFSLFLFSRKELYLLHFSLLNFAATGYILTHGEKLLYQLMPALDYRVFARLQYLSAGLSAMILLLYLYYSFPNLYNKIAMKSLIGISFALLPVSLVAPLSIQSVWSTYQMIFIQGVTIYSIYLMTTGILKRIEGSIFVGIGSVASLFMVTIAARNVLGNNQIDVEFIYAQGIFILSHAFLIASRFNRAYRRVEALSKELILQDKQKDEFLAKTSHEFRTPLHGIINIIRLYVEGEKARLNESQKKDLTLVIDIANRLSRLVNDILDLGRIREEKLSIKQENFPVNPYMKEVYDVCCYIYEERNNKLRFELPKEQLIIQGDGDRFKQILYNLVDNAMLHNDNCIITVKAEQLDEDVTICVEDNGKGIEEGKLEEIFLPYARLNEKPSGDRDVGTGLGLSIVKQLVELMGGTIKVESKVGEGTRFTVKFPAVKGESAEAAEAALASESSEGGTTTRVANTATPAASGTSAASTTSRVLGGQAIAGRQVGQVGQTWQEDRTRPTAPLVVNPDGESAILIADDHYANLKILVDTLSVEGYRIVAVKNGQEALDQIHGNRKFDLAILDIMMPDLSGYEVCRRIRERYNAAELPVLMLTAAINAADTEAALRMGANDFLHKPYQLSELRARVHALIEMKKSASLTTRYEIAFLHAQIKPHFLYNALNTIASYCEDSSPETAELIISLAKYLRGTLDFANIRTLIPMEKELAVVKAYLSIEKARFPRLSVRYEMDDDISMQIPPLSLQILVENAVKHSALQKDEPSEILVSIKRNKEVIRVSVWDNGVGFSQSKFDECIASPKAESGIGLYNLNQRLIKMKGTELLLFNPGGVGTNSVGTNSFGTTIGFEVSERGIE